MLARYRRRIQLSDASDRRRVCVLRVDLQLWCVTSYRFKKFDTQQKLNKACRLEGGEAAVREEFCIARANYIGQKLGHDKRTSADADQSRSCGQDFNEAQGS